MINKKINHSTAVVIALVLFLIVFWLAFVFKGQILNKTTITENTPNVKPQEGITEEQLYLDYLKKFDPSINLKDSESITELPLSIDPLFNIINDSYTLEIYSSGKATSFYDKFNLSERNIILFYQSDGIKAAELYYFTRPPLFDNLPASYKQFLSTYSCGNFSLSTISFSEKGIYLNGYEAIYKPKGKITTQVIVSQKPYTDLITSIIKLLNCEKR